MICGSVGLHLRELAWHSHTCASRSAAASGAPHRVGSGVEQQEHARHGSASYEPRQDGGGQGRRVALLTETVSGSAGEHGREGGDRALACIEPAAHGR